MSDSMQKINLFENNSLINQSSGVFRKLRVRMTANGETLLLTSTAAWFYSNGNRILQETWLHQYHLLYNNIRAVRQLCSFCKSDLKIFKIFVKWVHNFKQ